MATYPDHDRARKVFQRALVKAQSGDPLPKEWTDRIARIAAGRAKTYTPVLGTALLAKATDGRVDPLTLKASADSAHGKRAYTARGLGHEVLVPLAQASRLDLRVYGREPLNNSPFFRADRVSRGMDAKYPDERDYLVDVLERLKDVRREEAELALAAFIRHRRAATAAAGLPITLLPTGLDVPNLVLITADFVSADPETGRRGQAMVAAALDLFNPDVVTGNVFASSRKIPGDVVLGASSAAPVPIEVRQKPVERKDVVASVTAVEAAGFHVAAYIALDPKQPELPWAEILRDAAEAHSVALSVFTGASSFLAWTAALCGDPVKFVAEFPAKMLSRLEELHSSRGGREEWAKLVGATPVAAPAPTGAVAPVARRKGGR